MVQRVTTETCWLWTDAAEQVYETVKAGEPVFAPRRMTASKFWFDKLYITEARAGQVVLEL